LQKGENKMFDVKSPYFLGIEDLVNKARTLVQNQVPTYPPFNVRKDGDNKYVVEMAVAGYSENELSIEFDQGVLKVSGEMTMDNKLQAGPDVVYKGISTRPFERTIAVRDSVEVKNAELANGVLRVFLENMVAMSQPKKVPIKKAEQADIISK
jgi:molecular chaperone IbpA